ncbi:MAG: aldehyde dehydrogenase family protein [Clostridiales Family XIII bacterium]|jgi:acyl-CoA reductase-like NAD-dependent aldehyde dehydrogenase|nr:aldehyde dehydrogenase family protein [Clostridiales Family XIII bacterium]
MIEAKMLIGGKMVDGESSRRIDVINPSNEEVIGTIPQASEKDVDNAVRAAESALPAWQALDVDGRASYILEAAKRLDAIAPELAELEATDTGHTIRRVRGDISSASWFLRYYSGLGWMVKGETIPATPTGYHLTIRQPYGVAAKIVPFNHPVMFTSRLAAPLIAGNAVIMKAPREASLSILKFAEICAEVFPPGIVNIITGTGTEAGDAIVRHPKIKRIGFIGSEQTGLNIQETAARAGVIKHLTLELGGKNPMIVFPDADVNKAFSSIIGGMSFAWSGQSCGSLSRLFLHKDIYDKGVETIAALINALKVGDPLDEASDMGPIVHKRQYEKVLHYVQAGKEDGARLVAGGIRPEGKAFEKGYWVRPTAYADVTQDMRLFNEEVFGPILSIIRWSEEDEVIALANKLNLGLTGSVWSSDLNRALRTAQKIESGYIWVNAVSHHYKAAPFGGYKNSGIGKEEGVDEILSYTEAKTINVILD